MTRCKVGDLVVVIRTGPEHIKWIGSIATIIERVADGDWLLDLRDPADGFWWECADDQLRPIRDQPGTDETLAWAPVPSIKQTQPA